MQNKHDLFNFAGNYKQKLEEYVVTLEGSAGQYEREERMQVIEQLTDAYVEQTGKVPDGKMLERMTNVVLHEELTDRRADKMTLEEYPIMSDHQYGRRTTGSQQPRNKAGVVTYEVPLEHGSNVGIDGRDYTPHTRSFSNKR